MQETRPLLSMLCTLSGMFSLGLTDNLIVLVSETSSLWVFQTLRAVVAIGIIAAITIMGFTSLRAKRPYWVFLRNFFNAAALLVYFGCLAFLPIGVVASGFLTAPIFVLIFSVIFRGLKAGPMRWLAVALGFAGALMVVWPEDGTLTWLSLMPISAGALYAISAIGTRSWCEGEGTMVMTFAYIAILGAMGAVGLVVLTVWPVVAPDGAAGWLHRGYVAPDTTTWFVVVAQAVGSIIGVLLLTRGYQLGESSFVAINEYSMIIFASFFAWLLWGQTLGTIAFFGIACIILSGTIIALRSK
ncbi:DMT family transporter [Octadecabacter sp.]|nr:DMT family transporter [Octadecabacter sp.]